ncbi:MAG: thioredoxin [Longimicrobiales bacterium]
MAKATLPCSFCGQLNRLDLDRLASGPKCAQCGRPFLLDRPVKLSDADFDHVLADGEVPLLVDFYADWCNPCKVMAPILDDMARARQGDVIVAKLDTDRNPDVSGRFGIRGIPTLIVFKDGREVARHTGAAPRATIESLVDRVGT